LSTVIYLKAWKLRDDAKSTPTNRGGTSALTQRPRHDHRGQIIIITIIENEVFSDVNEE
jgi:hypothetical protein